MVTHEMCLFSMVSENMRVVIQWKIKNNEQTPINHELKETFLENFMTLKLLKCRKHYEGKFQHTPLDFSYFLLYIYDNKVDAYLP